MKRPYLIFVVAVVLPCALVMALTVALTGRAWGDLAHQSEARSGRMALRALQQEMGHLVDSLTAAAAPMAEPDLLDPALARAASGDTVTGLRMADGALAIRVALGDGAGGVRWASAALAGRSLDGVARATGCDMALYVQGRLMRATTDAVPSSLPLADQRALGAAPDGVVRTADGTLVSDPTGGDRPPPVAALARTTAAAAGPLPRPVILVMVLLLAFALMAGWIQLTRPVERANPRMTVAGASLVGLVPALAAILLLVYAGRRFEEQATDLTDRDLTRGLAVASAAHAEDSPATLRALTGYHAVVVQDGSVSASTFEGPVDGMAALPAPPPMFISSGRVSTPEGPSAYVARRLAPGRFVAVATPLPLGEVEALRRVLTMAGLALTAWLVLLAAAAWRRAGVSS